MTEEIQVLKDRIASLEAALGLKNETLTTKYKLTPAMGSLLGLLLELPIVTDEAIKNKLRIAADAKVAIYRLRRQLLPYAVEVHSKRGTGWYLDDETKLRIRHDVTGEVIERAA